MATVGKPSLPSHLPRFGCVNTTFFLSVLFCIQGATSFVNNEITEDFNSGGWGAALFSWSGMPLVFEGPVTVSGNSGSVSTVRLKDRPNRV